MTTFPNSPRLIKGAIVGLDLFNPVSSVVVFQYNPETVTRSLQVQGSGDGGDRSEAMRLKGAPIETIKMDVEIDATDQLEKADGITTALGIHPQLAALEMLVYPKSALVITNTILMALGKREVVPPIGPLTLLVWGLKLRDPHEILAPSTVVMIQESGLWRYGVGCFARRCIIRLL